MDEMPKKILVVDDDEPIRRWLELALTKSGYEVYTAVDGVEGQLAAKKHLPNLVITDLWMPNANGVELIEALGGATEDRRFIVLSAHLTESSGEALNDLGVHRVLSKPLDTDFLLIAVKEAMDAPLKKAAPEKKANEDAEITILIADDDETVRKFLSAYLIRKGYDVELAANGLEAVEKTIAQDIDIILMDLNMPIMHGTKAIDAIKRASRDICIACITGEANTRTINEAKAAGASSCLRKPFKLKELLTEIKRLESIAMHRKFGLTTRDSDSKPLLAPLEEKETERPVFSRKKQYIIIGAVVLIAVVILHFFVDYLSRPVIEKQDPINPLLEALEKNNNNNMNRPNNWRNKP